MIGAGLAGLAAALALAARGRSVTLHEAAAQAGGRCRSYREPALGCLIDNGNHLLLSGNEAARTFLAEIGSENALTGPGDARFPFLDLESGKRWTIRPGEGALPWWIFDRARRVPETTSLDYLEALKLAIAGPEATVAERVRSDGALYRHFWEPLTLAALNTEPQAGAASLLWRVLKDSFGRGAAACRPLVARDGLGPAFVEPALKRLAKLGVEIRFNRRLRAMERSDRSLTGLIFANETVALSEGDGVVLAVTPATARELLPDLAVPEESRPIVNAHFLLSDGFVPPIPFDGVSPLLGLFGGTAQW
ncbi:MAG: hydroxysqualene dehydroxylase, partial [Burkholderiales bacterium]